MKNRNFYLFILSLFLVANANAATYYVRSGGNDKADGRSHATAWATIKRVNSKSFSTSDSVLFHEGDVWRGAQLKITWSGTASKPALIGSYYVSGGQERIGFQKTRPVIDGEDRVPSKFAGLVSVKGDHVQIENLTVRNSEGRGILFEDARFGKVIGNRIINAYKSGIKIVDGDNALVEDNYITDVGRAYPEDKAIWGGAIAAVRSDAVVIRGNQVVEVYGEGINTNYDSRDTIIEDNYVFGAYAVGIYSDASPSTTIRRNIVLGTTNRKFWRSDNAVGGGIVLNNENYHYKTYGGSLDLKVRSNNAKIYANLVAYTSQGIGFWGGPKKDTPYENVLVYNNTLVDNNIQLVARERAKPGSEFVNNILLSISPGTKDFDRNNLRGMIARNNYFSQGEPGGDLSHNGNQFGTIRLKRQSGWRKIAGPNDISWKDFVVLNGSSTIGAGDSRPLMTKKSADDFHLDHKSMQHNNPMDMGALSAASNVTQGDSLNSPTDLTVKFK
jgi:parallel beta-helix repeat protein